MVNACFSPDGKHLVTASHDYTAKIYGLNHGQWQEKATIEHDGSVSNACFSLDRKHFVTASRDQVVKIFGFNNGQWQEKASINHDRPVNSGCFNPENSACFSPDGKHVMTTYGNCSKFGGKFYRDTPAAQ